MMAVAPRQAHPFAPLELDDTGSLEAMAEAVVKDHIFEDGNKRTSLVFALSVLRVAGTPVVLSDSPEPKDNQYYAWIQDLVSSSRTTSELAEELRRGCVAGTDDPSHV